MTAPSIGFIGFGEAGFHIGRGLREAGVDAVAAYDLNARTPGQADRIQRHSVDGGVPLVDSPEELAASSEVLLSTVVANAAADAARAIAPFLDSTHTFADLNSVSPETKRQIDRVVRGTGARFVEAAIMSPVRPGGHRSPMLLAGAAAADFAHAMSAYGMEMEVVSEDIGAAAAVKLCRSIVVKGLEALMIECSLAACHYGAGERVFSSLGRSFPGLDWGKLAGYMTSRVALHGQRRAQEMYEAARMLEGIGIEPVMASAAARRQEWCAGLGIHESFEGDPPEDYSAIAEAIQTLNRTDRSGGSVSSSVTEDSYNG